MLEEQGRRVESIMMKIVEDIDRKYIRKMQSNMYRCALNCCEDMSMSTMGLQRCVNECTVPVENAQKDVQSEFERSKKRLDRCFEDCRDGLQDKVGPNATEDSIKRYRGVYEGCAGKCLETYCDTLPKVEKSIKSILETKYSKNM